MQISRMALVYDVKISQLGRKNLAVRFDTYQMAAAPKTSVAEKITVKTRREIISSRE
jgi:hypothetical protein